MNTWNFLKRDIILHASYPCACTSSTHYLVFFNDFFLPDKKLLFQWPERALWRPGLGGKNEEKIEKDEGVTALQTVGWTKSCSSCNQVSLTADPSAGSRHK